MNLKTYLCLILMAVVTSISPALQAQTFSVLYAFTGNGDGANPNAGVTLRGGALFGTTFNSAPRAGGGTVFKLQRTGNSWTYAPIYIFNTREDGYNPNSRALFGPDGHLYSTTQAGGPGASGTVFQLTPPAAICKTAYCPWTKKVLTDIPYPITFPTSGDLVWDQQGNIYGATFNAVGWPGIGVYELTPSGNTWTYTLLAYDTDGEDSPEGSGGLVLDKNGNLLGPMCCGKPFFGNGSIYEVENVGGNWQLKTAHDFSGGDGTDPRGSLISDSSGNLYGATASGTVFELLPSGDTWRFKVLFNGLGFGPAQSLSFDAAGNLYGTTVRGGLYGGGSVFKLTSTPNGWRYTSMHDFKGAEEGFWPYSQVTIDTDGTLYGTTSEGGNLSCDQGAGCGVVWMIKP